MECSSRPHNNPARLIAAAEDEIGAFRRQRLSGPNVAKRLRRPISSIGVVQPRRGLGRLAALDPRLPIIRYEQ